MAKIELSPVRLTKDAQVVWQEQTEDADLIMDLKALTFRPESVDRIIANHVLDRMFFDEAIEAIKNWRKCLKKGGQLFLITDDFEYIARAFVGGDIDIGVFNRNHAHASQWDRHLLGATLIELGFLENEVRMWFEGIPEVIERKHYEIIIGTKK